ncbi:MAG TPA: hypothetical protein VM657_12120 [Sphingomonas sp.]|nr:hypothetical protein [Sphingomonas sp.]
MIKMGTIWDRTVAVIGDRTAALTPIVLALIFVPLCIQGISTPAMEVAGEGTRALLALVLLALSLLMLWGQLSIVALVVEPGSSARAAAGLGGRRLLPDLGISIVVGLIFLAFALPVIVAVAAAGGDWVATGPGHWMLATPLPAGIKLFVGLYMLVYVVFFIWAAARLALLHSVIVAERRGIAAIKRAFQLTRGLALKIIGVLILFLIVFAVCSMAVSAVLGSVFQLLFGGDGAITLATVLTAIASAAVTTAFTTLASVFAAELYLAARALRDAPVEAE